MSKSSNKKKVDVEESENDEFPDDATENENFHDETATTDDENDLRENAAEKFFRPQSILQKKKKTAPKSGGSKKTDVADDDEDGDDDGDAGQVEMKFTAVRDFFSKADERLPDVAQSLHEKYRQEFNNWLFYLSQGYNVLLHGYGSKKELLTDFCEKLTKDQYNHFIVRGYLSTVRIRDMLTKLADCLKLNIETSTPLAIADEIMKKLTERNDADVVLVVHNIDGPNFRDDETQSIFALLANTPSLHLIATVDNVNASLMWDLSKIEKFRWLYFDTPTYRSYADEVFSAGDSKILGLKLKNVNASHTLQSLQSVWSSLTDNARQIFMILVKHQLNTGPKSTSRSLSFWDLYKLCRDEFIVSTEAALKQQMIEFDDHHLITKRAAPDGVEYLEIAVDDKVLREFNDEHQDE